MLTRFVFLGQKEKKTKIKEKFSIGKFTCIRIFHYYNLIIINIFTIRNVMNRITLIEEGTYLKLIKIKIFMRNSINIYLIYFLFL